MQSVDYRFYKVTEIPEEKVSQYRLAMANFFQVCRKKTVLLFMSFHRQKKV
jgi:hypothetical protein